MSRILFLFDFFFLALPNKGSLPNARRSQNYDTGFWEKERAFIIFGSTHEETGDVAQICLSNFKFGGGVLRD